MFIDKPGFYKDQLGRKWEIVSIRITSAMGWLITDESADGLAHECPAVWDIAAGGACVWTDQVLAGEYEDCDLVAEWKEPHFATFVLYLFVTQSGQVQASVCHVSDQAPSNVLARKEVTIIEGEGINS